MRIECQKCSELASNHSSFIIFWTWSITSIQNINNYTNYRQIPTDTLVCNWLSDLVFDSTMLLLPLQAVCHQSDSRPGDPGWHGGLGEGENPGEEDLPSAAEWPQPEEQERVLQEASTHAEKVQYCDQTVKYMREDIQHYCSQPEEDSTTHSTAHCNTLLHTSVHNNTSVDTF